MNKKSFTLIEVLIVAVIIGVLASILYPNLESFRIRARLQEVYNTVELIKVAESQYYFKYGQWRAFNRNSYDPSSPIYDANVESDLKITIPKGDDAFCEYQMGISSFGDYVGIIVWTRDEPEDFKGDLYRYYFVHPEAPDSTWRSIDHPWHIYITADNEYNYG